jgi:transposase InsO family protein
LTVAGLDRQSEAQQPNREWVSHFTCIWTPEGRLYVAAVDFFFVALSPMR